MKKFFILTVLAALTLTAYAEALEYNIDPPAGANYGKATSIEVVQTRDNGERKNADISKNAALIPPGFGTPTADLPGSGEYLTPNLAPEAKAGTGAVINGSMSAAVVLPPASGSAVFSGTAVPSSSGSGGTVYQPGSATLTTTTRPTANSAVTYTEVTDDLYYSGGFLGKLEIPAIDLSVKIYEGTGSSTLAKGIGHFEETSIWGGNVALAAHNRGANNYFGQIHTLDAGDQITLTTKLGTKTYEVTTVSKVSETDRSGLEETGESCLTLYTCVRDQRDLRYCVRAIEVV
ncbi:class D sortase [uncultured Oscillibacter sp.]|uniref:class D sortase n=1 Tax=uncultured Oscillibacter sp. TaxID=876091 RepID=UPI00260F46C5|nr:class D sortase [uncultured Oscillibacter sp.]